MVAKILVVDDDVTCRNMVGEIASAAGYEAATATDGVEGWEKFQSDPADIVVLDYNMPRMNGMDLLIKIREFAPKTPVIMFTGDQDTMVKTKAWDLGVFDFLTKPVEAAKLLHVLRIAIVFELGKKPQPYREAPVTGLEGLREVVGSEATVDIIHQFRDQLEEDLKRFEGCVGKFGESLEEVKGVAHKLKGAAASLGLLELSSSCESVERKAKEGEELDQLVGDVFAKSEKAREILAKYLTKIA